MENPTKLRWKLRSSRIVFAAVALVALSGAGAVAAVGQGAAADGTPYRVEGGVTRPEKISGAAPVYTEMARRARVTGTVIVEAIIDELGNVTQVRVLKGLPLGLDAAAMDAVKAWKFKPATLDGRPVKVFYVLTVNFTVDDTPPPGPLLQRFLAETPDFAAHLREGRFTEAAQLLDRQAADGPAGPELALARCYLLVRQGQLEAAWDEARSYRGPEPFELLNLVGSFAWYRALHPGVLSPEARDAVIELGLQAATMALEARTDAWEAMATKAMLLHEKAKLAPSAAERLELGREAYELQRQALRLQAAERQAEGVPQN